MYDLHIRIIHKGGADVRIESLTPVQEGATELERDLALRITQEVARFLSANSAKCFVAAGQDRDQLERELDIQKSLDPDKFK